MSRLEDVLASIVEDRVWGRMSIVYLVCGCSVHLFAPFDLLKSGPQAGWLYADGDVRCGHQAGIQTPAWIQDFIENLKEEDISNGPY